MASNKAVGRLSLYRRVLHDVKAGGRSHIFSHDLAAMAAAVNERTRVLLLTNPNNPTGTSLERDAIASFAAELPPTVLLVVDQAYIEFAPDADVVGLVEKHPNLIVLQSFSKIYGLAGMRVGYAIGQPKILRPLRRLALNFHRNVVGYVGALAALDDTAHIARYRSLAEESRSYFASELTAMKLTFTSSVVPFVAVDTGRRGTASLLRERRVMVRPGKDWDLRNWIRISYGTMEENRKMVAALREVLS